MAVNAWDADWRSQPVLDGTMYGLEVRDGTRRRSWWLNTPDVDVQQNGGFLRLEEAIEHTLEVARLN